MSPSKSYYQVRLGKGNKYAQHCHEEQFIGVDYGIDRDLTHHLPDNWTEFKQQFIPVLLSNNAAKSKAAAVLACGALHTVTKVIQSGDIVLSPTGDNTYFVGTVGQDYTYHPNQPLPHRRPIHWYPSPLDRSAMSQPLANSTGSIGTVSNITKHAAELETLIANLASPQVIATDDTIEDPATFALERHLEDFLVHNWTQTSLGETYDIFQVDGEIVGQQFHTDTGPIDILAISKDNKELLVVELKKGRASDAVVGQIQRYMGYVLDELAEPDQTVRGIIIALEDDIRIRRALTVAPHIDFLRYQINFQLLSD